MTDTVFKRPQVLLESTIYLLNQLEIPDMPQVALAGRSNVGKSSLVNCLSGRKNTFAKVSSTPGKTRSLNFFRVQDPALYLVDLPGYGYARCSKTEREKWAKLIDTYFQRAHGPLQAVVLLIDCRHPAQELDLNLADYVTGLGLKLQPVLTKADKCKQNEQQTRLKEWRTLYPETNPLLFSSKTGKGYEALWKRIFQLAQVV